MLQYGYHSGVQRLVRDLNAVYRESPALWTQDYVPDGFGWIDSNDAHGNVLSFLRFGDQEHGVPVLACIANFSAMPHENYRVGLPLAGRWREVLNTDATGYGGSGMGNLGVVQAIPKPWHGRPASASIVLPPLSVLWLTPELPADEPRLQAPPPANATWRGSWSSTKIAGRTVVSAPLASAAAVRARLFSSARAAAAASRSPAARRFLALRTTSVARSARTSSPATRRTSDYQNHVHAHQVSVDRSDRLTTSCDPGMGVIVFDVTCYRSLQQPPRADDRGIQLLAAPPQLPVRGHHQARLVSGDDLGDDADDRVVPRSRRGHHAHQRLALGRSLPSPPAARPTAARACPSRTRTHSPTSDVASSPRRASASTSRHSRSAAPARSRHQPSARAPITLATSTTTVVAMLAMRCHPLTFG